MAFLGVVTELFHHPNSETFDIVLALGFQIVVPRKSLCIGQRVVVFRAGSIVPNGVRWWDLPTQLVTERLVRGVGSQGHCKAVVALSETGDSVLHALKTLPPGTNVSDLLGVTEISNYTLNNVIQRV